MSVWVASVLLITLLSSLASAAQTYRNPLVNSNCPDPGVIEVDGLFYVATTSEEEPYAFPIRVSKDLVNWNLAAYVFPPIRRPGWAVSDFWAPEIHAVGDHYVVFFAARDRTGMLCVGAARSNSVLGPFADIGKPLVRNSSVGMIDPTMYYDSPNDAYWLIWMEDGNGATPPEKHTPIWAQKLTDDGLALVGERTMILYNTLTWEGPLVEGPWLIYTRNYYYLFYSANAYYNNLYAVGVARSKNLLGPYTKHSSPIVHTSTAWVGPGHCSVIPVNNGEWVMIYHAWKQGAVGGNNNRVLMMDAIVWDSQGWPSLKNDQPSNSTQPAPPT